MTTQADRQTEIETETDTEADRRHKTNQKYRSLKQ